MSRFGDKVKSIFAVDYDDYDDDFYEDDYDEVEEEEPVVKPIRRTREKTYIKDDYEEEKPAPRVRQTPPRQSRQSRLNRNKVVPMRSSSDMEVCVIKPTYYESTREIIDTLVEGKAVVLNLEGMKLDLAQRIVDSVSGGCYALHGNLQKISGYIYLVTPNSVDITGDFNDLMSDPTSGFSSYNRNNY